MCASTGKANPSDWYNTIHGNLVMWVSPHVDDYMHNRFKEQLLIAIAIKGWKAVTEGVNYFSWWNIKST